VASYFIVVEVFGGKLLPVTVKEEATCPLGTDKLTLVKEAKSETTPEFFPHKLSNE